MGLVVGATAGLALATARSHRAWLAGLVLSQTLLLTGILQWGVWQAAEAETLLVSVERLVAMAADPPLEVAVVATVGAVTPPAGWPATGVLVLTDVTLLYRPDMPLALLGAFLTVAPGAHVALVGPSEAGQVHPRSVRLSNSSASTISPRDVEGPSPSTGWTWRRCRCAPFPHSPIPPTKQAQDRNKNIPLAPPSPALSPYPRPRPHPAHSSPTTPPLGPRCPRPSCRRHPPKHVRRAPALGPSPGRATNPPGAGSDAHDKRRRCLIMRLTL